MTDAPMTARPPGIPADAYRDGDGWKMPTCPCCGGRGGRSAWLRPYCGRWAGGCDACGARGRELAAAVEAGSPPVTAAVTGGVEHPAPDALALARETWRAAAPIRTSGPEGVAYAYLHQRLAGRWPAASGWPRSVRWLPRARWPDRLASWLRPWQRLDGAAGHVRPGDVPAEWQRRVAADPLADGDGRRQLRIARRAAERVVARRLRLPADAVSWSGGRLTDADWLPSGGAWWRRSERSLPADVSGCLVWRWVPMAGCGGPAVEVEVLSGAGRRVEVARPGGRPVKRLALPGSTFAGRVWLARARPAGEPGRDVHVVEGAIDALALLAAGAPGRTRPEPALCDDFAAVVAAHAANGLVDVARRLRVGPGRVHLWAHGDAAGEEAAGRAARILDGLGARAVTHYGIGDLGDALDGSGRLAPESLPPAEVPVWEEETP